MVQTRELSAERQGKASWVWKVAKCFRVESGGSLAPLFSVGKEGDPALRPLRPDGVARLGRTIGVPG